MLLLIDIGNTRLKWAIAPWVAHGLQARGACADDGCAAGVGATSSGSAWLANGAVTHPDIAGVGMVWAQHPITAVLVSNVAGATVAAQVLAELAALYVGVGADANAARLAPVRWFASEAEIAGLRNRYQPPERLGCDRLAAMIGARAVMPGRDLIVATCGTATTVDGLRADGVFIGGIILPGLATMARSLARATALLPEMSCGADGSRDVDRAMQGPCSTTLFADHTEAAMRNGCLAAQAGAIERAVAAHGNAYCLLSGGAAAWVAPWLQVPHAVQDNLVLLGLQAVAVAQPDRFSGMVSQPDGTGAAPGPKARTSC